MSDNRILNIKDMSFEEAMLELEKVVGRLEGGNLSLENSILDYEYGDKLRKYCEDKLKEAKLKVEQITKIEGGDAITEPVDIE